MLCLKFLAAGALGPYSRFPWPAPAASGPGAWVEAEAAPSTCASGIHACEADDLAIWLSDELWIVELAGAVTRAPHKLVAERGRLVRRVPAWAPPMEQAFAMAAVMRARDLAAGALRGAGEEELAARLGEARDPGEIEAALGERHGGAEGSALALGYLRDAVAYRTLDPRASAFCAAHAALDEAGLWRERQWQSRWIVAQLGLDPRSL